MSSLPMGQNGRPGKKLHSAISGLYDGISDCYGPANSFLTLGMDLYWRRRAAGILKKIKPGSLKILDVCCGTGDFSLSLSRIYGRDAEITAADLNEKMLSAARTRNCACRFVKADAAALPFTDGSFDAVTISFAARNLAVDREEFPLILKELLRVLTSGGVLLNLETAMPENFILKNLMKTYIASAIALLNLALGSRGKPYDFLKKTIFGFYSAKELSKVMLEAGFSRVEWEVLFPGAVAAHIAYKS